MSTFYFPLAVFMTHDGGEVNVRDYAGQSGRHCVIGPHTTDVVASFRTMREARAYIEKRYGPGTWGESEVRT